MDASDHARAVARHILAEGRFHQPPVPRPFAGVVRSLNGVVNSLGNDVGSLARAAPVLFVLAAAFVIAGLALLSRRLIGRRVHRRTQTPPAGAGAPTSQELERAARAAEREGDYAHAVRLRYRAGLARLVERGALGAAATLRGDQLRERLSSPTFDELNGTFEEVAYGGRSAAAADAEEAREGWPRVVEETRR
jgi:hypothetical protein